MKWVICVLCMLTSVACMAPCVPGASAACTCANGAPGAMLCMASGSFAQCMCIDGPASDAGGEVDAGADVDAGSVVCNWNRRPPFIAGGPTDNVLRVPIGAEVNLSGQVSSIGDRDWTLRYRLRDGGFERALAGDGGSALVDGVVPGRYQLDVELQSLCGESRSIQEIEIIAVRKRPFEISHGVCCDANRRAFVSVRDPARVLRLEADGGATEVAALTRATTSMSLGFDGTTLLVGQDSVVSGYDTESLAQRFSWPTDFAAPVIWASHDWVWQFDRFEQRYPQRLEPSIGEFINVFQDPPVRPNSIINVEGDAAAGCASFGFFSATAARDGGLRVLPSFESCCDGIFPTSRPRTVLSGCGGLSVFDGGLSYGGTLAGIHAVYEAAPAADGGEWVVTNGPSFSSLALCRVSLESLLTISTSPVGIANTLLTTSTMPNFMFVDENEVVHVFTPADGVTWEETFP